MKIAGFELGKPQLIGLGVVVGIIVIASLVSKHNSDKEKQARIDEANARLATSEEEPEEEEEPDEEEIERQYLIDAYGEPPEGFMWDDEGNLYALSDDTKTAEEVVYTFIRSLSIQDFSTAQKYSKNSTVLKNYTDYFDTNNVDADYYMLFLRKQYKLAITSIEVLNAEDSAVLADGTTVVSMQLNVLDLTNKDFWHKDKDELFKNIRAYRQTEDDDVKSDQYIYDYIYSKYEDGTVGKHTVTVNLTLTKEYGSGWLVADDAELAHQLLYEEGVNVAEDITTNYNNWLEETIDKEVDEADRKAEQREEAYQRKQDRIGLGED